MSREPSNRIKIHNFCNRVITINPDLYRLYNVIRKSSDNIKIPISGQTEIVNMLLTKCKGINIDAKNNLGFTPLMKAALQGRTKSAKLLLFAGK